MIKTTTLVLATALATAACGTVESGARPAAASERTASGPTAVIAQNAAPPVDSRIPKNPTREQIREEGRIFLAANAKLEGVVSLPSGVQYRVVRDGEGATPGPLDTVVVKYQGKLIDGSVFGSSGAGDASERFPMDRLVPGLAEALKRMKTGSNWIVYIPSALAFGERGPLEERVVIYDITLLRVGS